MSVNQFLSKKKYLYRIYEADDGQAHMERYPVVYANEKITYYKTGRKSELSVVDTPKVRDNCENVEVRMYFGKMADIFFWNADEKSVDIVEAARKRHLLDDALRHRKMAEQSLEMAKRQFDIADRRYNDIVSEVEK